MVYIYTVYHRMVSTALKMHEKPAFMPVSDNFTEKWNNILNNADPEKSEVTFSRVGQSY